MRFLRRFILGMILFLAGLGAAGYGAWTIVAAVEANRAEAEKKGGGPREREFAASVGTFARGVERAEIVAFGEIQAWRILELRTKVGGAIVELAENFRDGAEINEGDLLFRIDPEELAAAEADSRAAAAEAKADLAEAEQTLEVVKRELAAAETQLSLREGSLARQRDLLRRGVTTSTVVEEAEMALASAEQTAAGRSQSLLAAQIRIDRTRLKVKRAEIAVTEARRDLGQTEHRAPFRGLLAGVSATLGSLAAPNDRFGQLIDPTALEAVFRVTNAQFARLLNEDGELQPIEVAVTLELDDAPLTVAGVLVRSGTVIEAGETGRLLYAKLLLEKATLLRPGDFVRVTIEEPPLAGVSRIPAAAVSEAGEVLLVNEDDRLEAATVRIMRRVGDDILVADAPEGRRYVTDRAPQLGAGVKIKPIAPQQDGEAPAPLEEPQLVELAPDQQRRMIEFVEANQRMPKPVKERILSRLKTGKAPQAMVDRITQRMGG